LLKLQICTNAIIPKDRPAPDPRFCRLSIRVHPRPSLCLIRFIRVIRGFLLRFWLRLRRVRSFHVHLQKIRLPTWSLEPETPPPHRNIPPNIPVSHLRNSQPPHDFQTIPRTTSSKYSSLATAPLSFVLRSASSR